MEGLQTMYTETISLSSIDAVKKFVCIANEYDFTINLLSDKYKIDAKSIMSVFSLDLSKPITVEIEEEFPFSAFLDILPRFPSLSPWNSRKNVQKS